MESILNSVKKAIGFNTDFLSKFDDDLIMHINSALATLCQLGVGPAEGFSITGFDETWEDFIGDNPKLNFIKSYIFMKVKLIFDPPSTGFLTTSYENQIKELEWRITVETSSGGGN